MSEQLELVARGTIGAEVSLSSTLARQVVGDSLRKLGAYAQLSSHNGACLREAQRGNDVLLQVIARCNGGHLCLVADDPAGARRSIEQASWSPPGRGFFVPDLIRLEASVEVALYEGTINRSLDVLLGDCRRARRSLLHYVLRCSAATRARRWWRRLTRGCAAPAWSRRSALSRSCALGARPEATCDPRRGPRASSGACLTRIADAAVGVSVDPSAQVSGSVRGWSSISLSCRGIAQPAVVIGTAR